MVDRHGRTTWRMLLKFVLVLCASFFMHKYVMQPLSRVTDLFNIDCTPNVERSDGSGVDVGAPRAYSEALCFVCLFVWLGLVELGFDLMCECECPLR